MVISISKSLDDLETMSEYLVGSWRSPYVKIFSIGGRNRIAEVSNYPRAYKDTIPHVYTKDTAFTVEESDLNYEEEGERYYRDSRENLYRIGEKTTHWMGDGLPGVFPLWIEDENLPFIPNPDEYIFPIDELPGKKSERTLSELQFKTGQAFEKPDEVVFDAVKKQIATDKIKMARTLQDSDKQIIRFRYRRGV